MTKPYPQGHTKYHTIHLQAIPYIMPCSPADIIYHAISRQAIPYAMPFPAGHTIYHAMPTRPYHIRCHTSPGYTILCTIYHAIPHQTITYTMLHLNRPIDIPFDAHQAIPYTMLCPPVHNVYHAMPARPYHIPCHAR